MNRNMTSIKVIWVVIYFCCLQIKYARLLDLSTYEEVWTSEDKSIILPCQVIPGSPVMWLHPSTGVAISYKHNVLIPDLEHRMEIIGDTTMGRYDMFIKYAKFPDDVGCWTCVSIGFKLTVNVSISVPPAILKPQITPLQIMDVKHMAWTFTCSAQYAIPPVELKWVKVSGPDKTYDVILPDYVRSTDYKVAVTLRLVVSPLNLGSEFRCEANHPSFEGVVHSSTVKYAPPVMQLQDVDELQTGNNPTLDSTSTLAEPILGGLGMHGKAVVMVLVLCLLVTVITVVTLCLCRGRWSWNDVTVATSRKNKWTLTCKLVVWSLFSILLLLSCTLSFPVYFKGITIPLLGTDILMSVSAGSALWMDCTSKIHPIQSLLKVSWTYNGEPFYSQYIVNEEHLSFPYNSTLGYSVGLRTKSYTIGQISVWPMLPREDGVYACQVIALEDSNGRTKLKWKTFGVFVVTGPYLNYALLSLLGITLSSAVILMVLSLCHLIRCGKQRKQLDTDNGRAHSPLQRLYERPLMMGSIS